MRSSSARALDEDANAVQRQDARRSARSNGAGGRVLGELQEVIVYRIDIKIGTIAFERVEALSTRRPYVILGRNILQRLVMRVDGPGATLEIRLPRS